MKHETGDMRQEGNRSRLVSHVSREAQARFSPTATPEAEGLQSADDSLTQLIAPSAAKREPVGNRLEVKLPETSKPQTGDSPFTVLGAISWLANPATGKGNLRKASHERGDFNAKRRNAKDSKTVESLFAFLAPHSFALFAFKQSASSAAKRHWDQDELVEWFAKHFRVFDGRLGGFRVRRVAAAFVSSAATNPKGWRRAVRGGWAQAQNRRALSSRQSRDERDVAADDFVVKSNAAKDFWQNKKGRVGWTRPLLVSPRIFLFVIRRKRSRARRKSCPPRPPGHPRQARAAAGSAPRSGPP